MFHSRGDRDLGVAFQTHPGSQASCRREAKDSALLSSCDGHLLEPTLWPKGSQASCEVWREDLGLLSRPCRKRGPHLAMMGAYRGFSQGAVPGWGFSRDRKGSSGRLLRCHGSQVSMDVAWGSASLLSSHGRGIEPQDASKKNSRGLSRGVAGNPGFPRLVPMTSGSLAGFL